MKRLFALPLTLLALLGVLAAGAPVAQALPIKTVRCSGCHGGASASIVATRLTTAGATATYQVSAPTADAMAAFFGTSKVGASIMGTSGTFTVPVGRTYTLFAVVGPKTGNGIGSTVVVAKDLRAATVTKLVAPVSILVNKQLALTGSVVSSSAPGSVKITITHLVGTKWTAPRSVIAKVALGKYKYSFKPTVKGTWRFTATYTGGKDYRPSSVIKNVKVK